MFFVRTSSNFCCRFLLPPPPPPPQFQIFATTVLCFCYHPVFFIFFWIHLFAGTSELLCWDYQIILLESVSSIARRRQPLFSLARDVPGGATKLAKLEPAHNFAGIGSQFCWNRLRQEQRTNEDVATCGLFCWNRRRVLLHGGRTRARAMQP